MCVKANLNCCQIGLQIRICCVLWMGYIDVTRWVFNISCAFYVTFERITQSIVSSENNWKAWMLIWATTNCSLTPSDHFYYLYHSDNKLLLMRWWSIIFCTRPTFLVAFSYYTETTVRRWSTSLSIRTHCTDSESAILSSCSLLLSAKLRISKYQVYSLPFDPNGDVGSTK